MARRPVRLGWRFGLAAAVGVAVVIVVRELGLEFLPALGVGALGAALLYARIAGQPRVTAPAPNRRARRPARPMLHAGHEVIATRNLGGAFSDYVPRGTEGVITSAAWDGITASFTLQGAFGERQVQVRVRPDDVRRI
jgi:hypothetical protein